METPTKTTKVTRNPFELLNVDGEGVEIHVVNSQEELEHKKAELCAEAAKEKAADEKAAKEQEAAKQRAIAYAKKFKGFELFDLYDGSIVRGSRSGFIEFALSEIPEIVQSASIRNMPHADATECLNGIIESCIAACRDIQKALGPDLADVFAQAVYGVVGNSSNTRMHIKLKDTRGFLQICDMISILRVIDLRFNKAAEIVKREKSIRTSRGKTTTWTVPKDVTKAFEKAEPVFDALYEAIETANGQLSDLIASLRQRKDARYAAETKRKVGPKVVADPKIAAKDVVSDHKNITAPIIAQQCPRPPLLRRAIAEDISFADITSDKITDLDTSGNDAPINIPPPIQFGDLPTPVMPQQRMIPPPMHSIAPQQYSMPPQQYSMPPQQYSMPPQQQYSMSLPPQWLNMSHCQVQMTPMGRTLMIPVGYSVVMVEGQYGAEQWLHCDAYC